MHQYRKKYKKPLKKRKFYFEYVMTGNSETEGCAHIHNEPYGALYVSCNDCGLVVRAEDVRDGIS